MNRQSSTSLANVFSTSLKIITVTALTVVLLSPVTMIRSLIEEREQRRQEVVEEISSKWGNEQTIRGPVIAVPFTARPGEAGCLHILPDELDVTCRVVPEVRYRGIFEAVLYNTQLELSGTFSLPERNGQDIPSDSMIQWERAVIMLGVSDMRGITEPVMVQLNRSKTGMRPQLPQGAMAQSGVSAAVAMGPETPAASYTITMSLNGSKRLHFIPVGKTTRVSLAAPWPSPSFQGAYLPSERVMDKDGFTATWKVLDFNRAYPQQWTGDRYNAQVAKSAFGVGLYTPVDFYQKSTRAAKYAVLFVALMFAALFISEIVSRVRVHPIQYLFNGLAIITFYALLISLSEHTGFGIAYLVSSGAVTMLVTLYTRSVLGSAKLALILGAVLGLVYSYAYWVLQMVDYALLAGSVGLFVVLSLIMFATRNIDWYAIKLRRESEHTARQSQEPDWEIDESRLDD